MKDPAARADAMLDRLRTFQADAESTWTPGQALGEISAHLAPVESFPGTVATADCFLTRTRRLTRVLRAAAQRSEAAVPDLNLDGVLSALQRHDSLTTAEGTVQAPSMREARDLVRMEISYVLPPPASGSLTVQPTS